jgi:hypothetical protein
MRTVTAIGVVLGMTARWISPTRRRQRIQIGERLEPHVRGAQRRVVDVAEHSAAGAALSSAMNSPSGMGETREAEIARGVLDEEAPAQPILRASHVVAHDDERLVSPGQGEEMVEIHTAAEAPGQVLGHEARGEPVGERVEPSQMLEISTPPPLPSESPTPWSERG